MKKILTAFLTAILLLALGTTAVFAEESAENYDMGGIYSETDIESERLDAISDGGSGIDTDTGTATTDAAEDSADVKSDAEAPKPEASENIFADIYRMIASNSDKLFSALSFIASVCLAFVYKNGLLPSVKGAIDTLGEKVSEIKEKTGEANTCSAAIEKKLRLTEEYLESLSEKLEIITEELDRAVENDKKNADMRGAMLTEIDMLYNIFMQSSLPEYQKEAISERVAEMKSALKGADVNA